MCCFFSSTHQLCVSFLPPRPHDTHSRFDWQLTLMIHASPPICLSAFLSSEEAFRFFVFSKQERLISQFVQTFSFFIFFCHLECLAACALQCGLLGYHACSPYRAVVQESRMCGGNFTSLVIPGKLPRSPSISCSARLSSCVFVRVSKTVFVCSGPTPERFRQKQADVISVVIRSNAKISVITYYFNTIPFKHFCFALINIARENFYQN